MAIVIATQPGETPSVPDRRAAAGLAPATGGLVPTHESLDSVLPDGGLRRGSIVAVDGIAATSLSLILLAGPSAAGSWCAAVGLPSLGLLAASELGIALERLALIPRPGNAWPAVAAALLDAFELVLVRPTSRASTQYARRLAARTRERRAVLILLSDSTSFATPDLHLTGAESVWDGLGWGSGTLRTRQVRIHTSGRGAAGRPRHTLLWLPGPQGVPAVAPAPFERHRLSNST